MYKRKSNTKMNNSRTATDFVLRFGSIPGEPKSPCYERLLAYADISRGFAFGFVFIAIKFAVYMCARRGNQGNVRHYDIISFTSISSNSG